MDTLIVQNMQIMESNRQMIQTFMQTIERLALSRQALFSLLYPFPQPIANLYDNII
jgi:hypothetical protein